MLFFIIIMLFTGIKILLFYFLLNLCKLCGKKSILDVCEPLKLKTSHTQVVRKTFHFGDTVFELVVNYEDESIGFVRTGHSENL